MTTLTVPDLIKTAMVAGATVIAESPDQLRVKKQRPLPPELVAELKARKSEIIAALIATRDQRRAVWESCIDQSMQVEAQYGPESAEFAAAVNATAHAERRLIAACAYAPESVRLEVA